MRLVRTALLAGAVGVFCLGGPGLSQGHSAPASSTLEDALASHIVGLKVEDLDGERLGTVDDFVVDLSSGRIRYAILSSGGFLGLAEKRRAVPPQALSMATAKKDTLALQVTQLRWKQAPDFRKRDLPALGDPNLAQSIYQLYGQSLPEARSTKEPAAPGTPKHPTSASSAPAAHKHPPGSVAVLRLASDVIGKTVIDPQQKKIGKIRDLLVDLAGQKAAFALVSTRDALHRKQVYAISLRALRPAPRGRLVLDAAPLQFEQAQPFDPGKWQAADTTGHTEVFQFDIQ